MRSIAYYDGTTGAPEELTIPFNDRSHFFGDGVYDAATGANGKVFALEDHLDRFYSSAAAFGIHVPLDKDELSDLLISLLAHVDGKTQFVYWQVTRGVAERNHVYDPDMCGKLWVFIREEALPDPHKPLKLVIHEDRRFEYGNIKTLNLMPAVQYAQFARNANADEAVLHRNGVVTECAHSNVSILKGGTLYSHPNDEHILRGIAKTHLFQACYRESVPVIERAFTLEDLANADEIIITSSGDLCSFANQLEGKPVGGKDPETLGKLRRSVFREFFEYTGADSLF